MRPCWPHRSCPTIAMVGVLAGLVPLLGGCAARSPAARSPEVVGADRRLTVGVVQLHVRVGVAAADVAGTLGSPNIVTTDAEGQEVWIYDRIYSERTRDSVAGWAGGAGPVGAGVVAGAASGSHERTTVSQRTLTVVVRFDRDGRVEQVRYHTSRF